MIALDFTPTEEAQIITVARQTGLAPADYVKKLVREHLPPLQAETQAQPNIPMNVLMNDEKRAAAIAMLNQWTAEEATDDPEEVRKADAEVQELMESLNRNRIESGERPLFP